MQTLETPSSQALTDIQILDGEKLACQKNPLYLLDSAYLSIVTKKGEMVKLKVNHPQSFLLRRIKKMRAEHKPIRIWLLKARQEGFSTLVESVIYALTSQQENRKSLIMADQGDKSTNLFGMTKLYQEMLEADEAHLAPQLKKSNEKALEFEDIHSKIIIETAQNVDATRSYTYNYVHLSECAFFPDLTGVMRGLNQSVPDHWDTIIIGETTANGREQFYREWLRAIKGETDWIPVFVPWFWLDDYSKPLEDNALYPLIGVNFGADYSESDFLQEETDLRVDHDLTKEQTNWRRWAIVNKCGGDIDSFKQEYPATWHEAFAMSGACFFDRKGLEWQEKVLETPKAYGELYYVNMGWEFREVKDGRLRIYEYPTVGEQYIIVFDPSEGLVAGDEAAGVVLNKRTNQTSATLNGPYSPEDLAEIGIALGNWYNNGLATSENKGYGYMVNELMFKKYGNMYRRKKKNRNKEGVLEETDELGYNTNGVTRPQCLAALDAEVKNHSTVIKDKSLHSELLTFVQPKDKEGRPTKPEAEVGCQDGLVMARAIASKIREEFPYVKRASSGVTKALRLRRLDEIRRKNKNAGFGFGGK